MDERARDCPSDDDLARWLDRSAAPEAITVLDRHLDSCVTCRHLVAALGRAPLQASPEIDRRFHRYEIREVLGAGGMGIVYRAYDPELGREVALKRLHGADAERPDVRDRLRREARTLARLGHPAIVTVYDVGEVDGELFFAMELLRGTTLEARMRDGATRWPEALALLLPAARGLAAAHAAGIVHRDFKPANVMIADDGRVIVMDFGVAGGSGTEAVLDHATQPDSASPDALTRTGELLGTPLYMAPEQFGGGAVTESADQFGFCVTAWELLFGERPYVGKSMGELRAAVASGRHHAPPTTRGVPRWLRRACERGLVPDPANRWPSMAALIAELERGRARTMRTRAFAVLGVTAVAAIGVVTWQRIDHDRRSSACEAAGARVDRLWNDDARDRVRTAFSATGMHAADVTAEKAIPWLDEYAEQWRTSRTLACTRAIVDRTTNAADHDRALWCLEDRRLSLASLVEDLALADRTIVLRSVQAASALPSAAPCNDAAFLAAQPPPPAWQARPMAERVRALVTRASVLQSAGKFHEGLALVRAALVEAAALDWPPLTATALEVEGDALTNLGENAEAERVNTAAYLLATKADAWEVAVRTASEQARHVGYTMQRHAEGRLWAGLAESALAHAQDGLGTLEADRLLALGGVEHAAGDYAGAAALYERALAIFEAAHGGEHPNVSAALTNRANALRDLGEVAQAKALLERSIAIDVALLGPEHPDVALDLMSLANIEHALENGDEARALFERAVAIQEAVLGPEHPNVATALNNLAVVSLASGDVERGRVLLERSIAIREKTLGPDHPELAGSIHNLAHAYGDAGDNAKAQSLYERALAIREKALGPDHPFVAETLANLGVLHSRAGDHADAEAMLSRALAIQEKALGKDHPDTLIIVQFLADALRDAGEPARADPLYARAAALEGG